MSSPPRTDLGAFTQALDHLEESSGQGGTVGLVIEQGRFAAAEIEAYRKQDAAIRKNREEWEAADGEAFIEERLDRELTKILGGEK